MALLPANVLLNDPGSQWLRLGVPLVLQQDLMTAHNILPGVVGSEANAAQGGATHVMRTTVDNRQGKLRIEATLLDLATKKDPQVLSVDADSIDEVIPALNALAKQFDASASDFSSKSAKALETFSSAAASSDGQARAQLLNRAVSQDAGFGAAYISLIEMLAPSPQNSIPPLLEAAKTHRNEFTPYDAAKFDLTASRLSLAPVADQIKAADAVLKIAPNDTDVLALLGMDELLNGDANAGVASLRHAADLNPANVPMRNQLARGLMQAQQFKEAEAVFTSIDKNPAVLPELAVCILLEGDTARADAVEEKFLSSLKNEEIKPLLHASWDALAGRRQKAIDAVLAAKFGNKNLQTVSLSEAAVWQATSGDYAGAQKTVQLANQAGGQTVSFASVAAMIIDKTRPAEEWRKRVQASPFPEQVKAPLLAYGLFLNGHFDEAAEEWQKASDKARGTDLRARAMLASSLDRAGKKDDARKIHVMPFVPEFGDLYAAISFDEMRRMLALQRK